MPLAIPGAAGYAATMTTAVMLVTVLLLAAPAVAQCDGDLDGDGRVGVADAVRLVGQALGECGEGASPTPTRTPERGVECPIDFAHPNDVTGVRCTFVGRPALGCNRTTTATFVTDGTALRIIFPDLYLAAVVTGARTASIVGWYTQPDASDLRVTTGAVALDPGLLGIYPDDPNAARTAGCPLRQFRGTYQQP